MLRGEPSRVGQVGVVEASAHRTVPVARTSALQDRRQLFNNPLAIRDEIFAKTKHREYMTDNRSVLEKVSSRESQRENSYASESQTYKCH